MISDFGIILLFIITAIITLAIVFGIAKFIRPHKPNDEKLSTYESGEEPEGNANVQFNIRYYIVALVFILFEVEIVFLFPWATVFGNKHLIKQTGGLWGWVSMIEMFVFIALLALGLAYAWIKGYLDWVKPEINLPDFKSAIPKSAYEKYLK
jgi:NADH-quinone oxidoreductase subunit A